MKNLFYLPKLENPGLWATLKHIGSVVLFTGLAYYILAILAGGFSWKYVQSPEDDYIVQFFLLLFGVVGGIMLKVQANRVNFPFFFHFPKLDKYLYPIGFVLAYLIINEIFGM